MTSPSAALPDPWTSTRTQKLSWRRFRIRHLQQMVQKFEDALPKDQRDRWKVELAHVQKTEVELVQRRCLYAKTTTREELEEDLKSIVAGRDDYGRYPVLTHLVLQCSSEAGHLLEVRIGSAKGKPRADAKLTLTWPGREPSPEGDALFKLCDKLVYRRSFLRAVLIGEVIALGVVYGFPPLADWLTRYYQQVQSDPEQVRSLIISAVFFAVVGVVILYRSASKILATRVVVGPTRPEAWREKWREEITTPLRRVRFIDHMITTITSGTADSMERLNVILSVASIAVTLVLGAIGLF